MSGYIYILTDGVNTKIGVTTDIEKRMASYKTHNATAQLVKSYPCEIDEAKRVETAIKHIFKGKLLEGKGKEWFSVSTDEVDKFVSALLDKVTDLTLSPSAHGAKLTYKAHSLLTEIANLLAHKEKSERLKAYGKKDEMAELFATAFSLGLPEHKLPDTVLLREAMGVDMAHCQHPSKSQKVKDSIAHNRGAMPYDDHIWRFFRLVKLATGHYIALSTAKVSMPYLEEIRTQDSIREMVDTANEIGWNCTLHNDWSWHWPDKTGLVLYQPKTDSSARVRQFEGSFRKWVIERQELLKVERFNDPDTLTKAIEDIVHDNTFPLGVKSYAELGETYLKPIWWIEPDEFFAKAAYEFLFSKWTGSHPKQ